MTVGPVDARCLFGNRRTSARSHCRKRKPTSPACTAASRIEGDRQARVGPSFFPSLVQALPVPDAASVAALRWPSKQLGQRVGASTGTNSWGTIRLAHRMNQNATAGSVVSLICDDGSRYSSTYYKDGPCLRQPALLPGTGLFQDRRYRRGNTRPPPTRHDLPREGFGTFREAVAPLDAAGKRALTRNVA